MFKKQLITLLALGAAFYAHAEFGPTEFDQGQKTIGAQTGFTEFNNTLFIGAEGTYNLMSNIRLAGNFVIGLPNLSIIPFAVNLDSHYSFGFSNVPKLRLYPVGGLNITWGVVDNNPEFEGIYKHSNYFSLGLNLGVGAEWSLNDNLSAFAEGKDCIHLVGNSYSYSQFSTGIRYKF